MSVDGLNHDMVLDIDISTKFGLRVYLNTQCLRPEYEITNQGPCSFATLSGSSSCQAQSFPSTPIKLHYFPRSPAIQAIIDEEVQKILGNELI